MLPTRLLHYYVLLWAASLAACCLLPLMVVVHAGLEALHIHSQNNNITDAALPTVARHLSKLSNFSLDNSRVSDKGVRWLRQLTTLTRLSVQGCSIRDPELRAWDALLC